MAGPGDIIRQRYRRLYTGMPHGRRINSVGVDAECLFWRLCCICDDYGCLLADAKTIKSGADPRGGRAEWSEARINELVADLMRARLAHGYKVARESYIHLISFQNIQPAARNGKRYNKYPYCTKPSCKDKDFWGNPGASGCVHGIPTATSTSTSTLPLTETSTKQSVLATLVGGRNALLAVPALSAGSEYDDRVRMLRAAGFKSEAANEIAAAVSTNAIVTAVETYRIRSAKTPIRSKLGYLRRLIEGGAK